jgi:hypothetical protein
MKPILRAFVPCLNIENRDDGSMALVKPIHQVVVVGGFPARFEFQIYFAWHGLEERSYQGVVRMRVPGSPEAIEQPFDLPAEPLPRLDETGTMWMRCEIRELGDLVFDIFLEGESVVTYRMPVIYGDMYQSDGPREPREFEEQTEYLS